MPTIPFARIAGLNIESTASGKLITIGATPTGGKTIGINSLARFYLKSGVNVFLFTENSSPDFKFVPENKENRGDLIIFPIVHCSLSVDFLFRAVTHHLNILKGNSVILLDAFVDSVLDTRNTRYVLIEKVTKKNKTIEGTYYHLKRQIAEKLRNISTELNMPVIVTSQHRRDNFVDSGNQVLLYNSDVYITTERIQNTGSFNFNIIKSRYSECSSFLCEIDRNSLTFVTN